MKRTREPPPTSGRRAVGNALHRCQRYENEIGVVPLHEPAAAVSVCPSTGVPEIVGLPVFAGGVAASDALAARALLPLRTGLVVAASSHPKPLLLQKFC